MVEIKITNQGSFLVFWDVTKGIRLDNVKDNSKKTSQ